TLATAETEIYESTRPRPSSLDRLFSSRQPPQPHVDSSQTLPQYGYQSSVPASDRGLLQYGYQSTAPTPHYGFPQLDPYSTHVLQQQEKEHKQKEGQRQKGIATGLHRRSSTDESQPNRDPKRQKVDGHSAPDTASAGSAVTGVTGAWQSSTFKRRGQTAGKT
ncbi:hypothetical protein KCU71_g9457, partial [Aureobasidium melanogenum]